MGYITQYDGEFTITPQLTKDVQDAINGMIDGCTKIPDKDVFDGIMNRKKIFYLNYLI